MRRNVDHHAPVALVRSERALSRERSSRNARVGAQPIDWDRDWLGPIQDIGRRIGDVFLIPIEIIEGIKRKWGGLPAFLVLGGTMYVLAKRGSSPRRRRRR